MVPVSNVLPNDGSSSDSMTLVPLKHKSKVEQDHTYNREAAKKMIDYPEDEVKNITEKTKLSKDSENTVEGYIRLLQCDNHWVKLSGVGLS